MAVLHFSHTGICVADIERSTAFYRDVFGFTQHHGMHLEGEPTATLVRIPDVRLDVVYLERDGTVIELLSFPKLVESRDALPRELNRKGLTHLSFNVNGIETLLEEIEQAGGSVMQETQLGRFGDPVVAIFVTDPDGTLIELVQSPADPKRLPTVPEGMQS